MRETEKNPTSYTSDATVMEISVPFIYSYDMTGNVLKSAI